MIDIVRSQPAPDSLASEDAYDGDDVKERLRTDFLAKCYLCEGVFIAREFEVDHRRPKAEFPELKYSWDNLFPACHHCNQTRHRSWRKGGYLSPGADDDLETRLVQELVTIAGKLVPSFDAMRPEDLAAVNTAHELDHVHNHTRNADHPRNAIHYYCTEVWRAVAAYLKCQQNRERDEAAYSRARLRVKKLVSRRAPYTTLIRSQVRDYVEDLFD